MKFTCVREKFAPARMKFDYLIPLLPFVSGKSDFYPGKQSRNHYRYTVAQKGENRKHSKKWIIFSAADGSNGPLGFRFRNTVYNDSKLKKTSKFYKVDYLCREDVMEWLLNLEKYSKITAYKLTEEDAEKIWDAVGGSMWEIQSILSQLFDDSLDDVLALYKKKMRGIIAHYCQFEPKKKQVLQVVKGSGT